MPIVYDKMIKKFDEVGLNSYKIKKDKIIGTVTYQKIRHGGDIDTRTIARMCKFFDCQRPAHRPVWLLCTENQ